MDSLIWNQSIIKQKSGIGIFKVTSDQIETIHRFDHFHYETTNYYFFQIIRCERWGRNHFPKLFIVDELTYLFSTAKIKIWKQTVKMRIGL